MADAEDKKNEAAKTEKKEKPQSTGGKTGILTWIIMAVVVVVLAGSGFVLGRLFASSPEPQTAESPNENKQESAPAKKSAHGGENAPAKKSAHGGESAPAKKSAHGGGESAHGEKKASESVPISPDGTWYFNDLESVVVNPDEPGATRYVRVGLILEIGPGLAQEEVAGLILAQKPLLINWLNLYFKSLTLSEMQNDKDMKRILSQICDAFNEIIFPSGKPQIKTILIREFNIQ